MYTVDLLRGEGIPIRSRPGGIAFACLIVAVPLLTSFDIVSFYLDCDVVIAIQKQQLKRLDSAAGALSDALEKKESLENEKALADNVLSDVGRALTGYTQWSPALTELVGNLSDTLVLTRLEAKQDVVRRKVAAKDGPARMIDLSVPVRSLKIGVCGQHKGSSSEAVKRFEERLRSSATIGPMLDTVSVSQDATMLDGREAVLYELNCVFKPMIR